MEWVLQEAFQDQRHPFSLNTIGIHHLSAEGPVQLWSFFMRRSTSVIGCMHQDQAAYLPSRLDQTIMVCFWVTDDIYSPEMHLYHSWQLGWHLHDKKKDNISMMSVQHNYAVNKKKKNIQPMVWKVQSFSQSSRNCRSLCSESTSRHLAALTLHQRRLSLMIAAL